MANSLNGVKIGRISQLTLDVLQAEMLPLKAFVTDFSDEIKAKGESVTTRFVNAPTVQDFAASKAASNQSTVARTITLDQFKGVSMEFTERELTFTDVELVEKFIQPAIVALVEDIVSTTLGLLVAADFAAATVLTTSTFDADAVADLAEKLTTAKVGKDGRSLIIKPTYNAALVKDSGIKTVNAYGDRQPILNSVVPRLHGFDIHEYAGNIPGNGESLVGVALRKQALCIAARTMALPPEGTSYGVLKNIQEPVSGLPMRQELFWDHQTGLSLRLSTLFGVGKGVTGNAHRIVSA